LYEYLATSFGQLYGHKVTIANFIVSYNEMPVLLFQNVKTIFAFY